MRAFSHQQLLKPALNELCAIIWAQSNLCGRDRRETEAMKILMVAAAMLALIATPAQAQVRASGIKATKRRPNSRKRGSTRRPTRPRSIEYPSPRKSMTLGASRGPRSLPRNRNRPLDCSVTSNHRCGSSVSRFRRNADPSDGQHRRSARSHGW